MKSLKKALANRETLIGSWITLSHLSIAEIMADCGFDFLVIDMEHSTIELSEAQNLVRVIQKQDIPSLIRVNNMDPDGIKRAMDTGTCGVIVPMVKTKQHAEQIVSSVKYPPEGKRGIGLARAQKYGFGFEEYKQWLSKESVVIALIEHIDAIHNLREILGVSGLDGTIIGPYDLSGSIGFPGQFKHSLFKEAIRQYEKVSVEMKKTYGRHVVQPDIKTVREVITKGYSFLPVGLDTLFLGLNCKSVVQKIKKKKR